VPPSVRRSCGRPGATSQRNRIGTARLDRHGQVSW
jgi:hypothetical protein